jgi:sorting and assembly machinery component 37
VTDDRLSTVDLRLYAHLALLLTPLPNPLLADLLRSTYPALVEHHDRIAALLPESPRITPSTPTKSWWDLWPGSSSVSGAGSSKPKNTKTTKTSKDKSFERARWAWFATAGFGLIGYMFAAGIIQIDFGGGEEEWRDASEFEEDEEEEEEIIEIIEDDEE